jgi:hypothetical protein
MRACATACFIVGLSAAGQAQAQSQAPEPPATQAPVSVPEGSVPESSVPQGSAIFGAAEGRGLAARTERVDLVIQVFGGYDDDVLAEGSGGAPNQRRLSSSAAGLATGVGAAITYSRPGLLVNRPGAKGDFKAIADSSIRYYPGLDNLTGQYHRFGLQLSAPVNRRLTLYASPRADYSPRYAFELLSGPLPADPESAPSTFTSEHAPAPAVDYSVVANNSFRYGAVGGAELRLGTQSSLTVDGGYTKRRSDIAAFDMEVRNAGVSFEHRFTRSAGLELGYSYIDGNNASALATRAHNIDIGIDYRRPLSQTRRTFVSFNTGSTVAESEIGGRRMQAIGSASLVHYIKRTWTALVEYRRRLHYVEGFDRPLFGDAVTTGFNGLLSRQMELVVRASYTNGSVGVRANAPRFESYTASARVRRALSRRLAGYAEALFFHYAFDDAALRPPGIPQTFDRVAVRCGLSLWVPLGQ